MKKIKRSTKQVFSTCRRFATAKLVLKWCVMAQIVNSSDASKTLHTASKLIQLLKQCYAAAAAAAFTNAARN
jgi:hypothetical protein